MPRTMYRGKQQILFNYLPNRTFDFERVPAIARVVGIRGDPRTDLNASVLLRRIAEEVAGWQEDFRPALRDEVLRHSERFVLLDPKQVQSELFPKVLWCQNAACGRVFDFRRSENLPDRCPVCHEGQMVQLRFVRIHVCGEIQPLLPPTCQQCQTTQDMALVTRGSERISNFRWICRKCNKLTTLWGGICSCNWPAPDKRAMDIEVHRAGRAYYAHTTILLNIPHRQLDSFFSIPEWPAVAAAKFLQMPEVVGHSLADYGTGSHSLHIGQDPGLSAADLNELLGRQRSGELTPQDLVNEMESLLQKRRQEQESSSPSGLAQIVSQRTGVPWPVWQRSGQEMLEATMPLETGRPTVLTHDSPAFHVAKQLGIQSITLLSDYPIITATYGFSRAEYLPNRCRLNPFPSHQEHGGKFPIFVDQVQADALLIKLDSNRVISWLERNGSRPNIPSGSDQDLARRSYFVQLFTGLSLRETIRSDQREARMAFGLLHTLSHLSVRQAALLSGLDRTSLSEYMLPRTLTFAIYCNHRFGATIGALTALFEQSLEDWLNAVRTSRRCVYDPVCRDSSGNCHACTHLAETSCRFFNLNLSRAFLFGGRDSELGDIAVGYLDPSLTE